MHGELLDEVDTCRNAASPLHPLKTFTTWVLVALIRKHKQSASFFYAVR